MFSRKPSRSFSGFVLFNVTPDPVDHPPLLAMLDIETWVRTHTAFSSLRCGNGGSMIFGFNLVQWIMDRLTEIFNALNGPLAPLFNMISSTSLTFTTQNAVVIAGWRTMTSVADVLLGLFIVIGTIQIMYGDTTNSLRMPIGQFVGKVMLTAILIHLSAFLGEQLLILNNLLCGLVAGNVQDFIRGVNHGQLFNDRQNLVLAIVFVIVFVFSLFRVFFQAIQRVIRFNLLFVLSGPAFLTSVHPATAPVFSSWIRLYVVTIFEQFIQDFLEEGAVIISNAGTCFFLGMQRDAAQKLNLADELERVLEEGVSGRAVLRCGQEYAAIDIARLSRLHQAIFTTDPRERRLLHRRTQQSNAWSGPQKKADS